MKIDQKLRFEGRLERKKGRLYITSGVATNDDGETVATASGKYIEAKDDMKEKLMASLES